MQGRIQACTTYTNYRGPGLWGARRGLSPQRVEKRKEQKRKEKEKKKRKKRKKKEKNMEKRVVTVLEIPCSFASEVIRPSEVDWQSFKHVRVYFPIVHYIKYINATTILHKNRPKNTRIIMPFIPIAY